MKKSGLLMIIGSIASMAIYMLQSKETEENIKESVNNELEKRGLGK